MSTNRAPVESGLQDIRLEWVEETTPGVTPTDPAWNKFTASDLVTDFTLTSDPQYEQRTVLGDIDPAANDRGAESASATVSYHMGQFPVDAGGTVQDPIAYPIVADPGADYPSHTVVARREVTEGGPDGTEGFREYGVVRGARPVSATIDGDAGSPVPLPQELSYEAEKSRVFIIWQPAEETPLVVQSSDPSDTNEVVIESEGAQVTETVTLPGGGQSPNNVATTSGFPDIDAIEVQGSHTGTIRVGTSDGASPPAIATELTPRRIFGSQRDGVESEVGVPALGDGSHASDISEQGPQFIATTTTLNGQSFRDQIHTQTVTVERETSRTPQQTTRRQVIDVGSRSTSIDITSSGPIETAKDLSQSLINAEFPTLTYEFEAGEEIIFNNLSVTSVPDLERSAGDTNVQPSITLTPTSDPSTDTPAISINKTSQ